MATTLGYESYDPRADLAYRESIVSGIQSMGAEVQKQLRGITEKKQLTALGEELQTMDPASPDFAHRMAETVTRYPLASSSAPGVAAINMLGKSHLQILENQQFQLRQGAQGGGWYNPDAPATQQPRSPRSPAVNRVGANSQLIESELPLIPTGGEEVVQDESAFFMEPPPEAGEYANPNVTDFTQDPMSPQETERGARVNAGAVREGPAKGIPVGGLGAKAAAPPAIQPPAPAQDTRESFVQRAGDNAVEAEYRSRGRRMTNDEMVAARARAEARADSNWDRDHPTGSVSPVKLNPKTGKLEMPDGTVMKVSKVGPGGTSYVVAEGGESGTPFAQPLEEALALKEKLKARGIFKVEPNSKGQGYVLREITPTENAEIKAEADRALRKLTIQVGVLDKSEASARKDVDSVLKADTKPAWFGSTGAQAEDPSQPVSSENPLMFKFDNMEESVPAGQGEIKQWQRFKENNQILDDIKAQRDKLNAAVDAVGDTVKRGANSPAFQAASLKAEADKAPAQGADEKVSVMSPSGVRGKIPRSHLDQAVSEGYKLIQ